MVERVARVLEMKRGGRALAQPLAERDFRVLRVKCEDHIRVQSFAEHDSRVLGTKCGYRIPVQQKTGRGSCVLAQRCAVLFFASVAFECERRVLKQRTGLNATITFSANNIVFSFCLLTTSSTFSSMINNPLGLQELLRTSCKLSFLGIKVNHKSCISVTWSRGLTTVNAVNSSC